jgi:small subunit ribosomal protein S20
VWARFGKNHPFIFEGALGLLRDKIKPTPRDTIPMANTAQSKKRARQSEARQDVNKARRSRIRTFLRKVEEALASGNQDAAALALKNAQPELARGVSKGVLHKNTVSRKISRLASRVKALATPAA